MIKLVNIVWDGAKNATLVFFVFYFTILTIVTFNSEQGISLMLNAETYVNTIKQPLVIGMYCLLLAVSIINSYKKFAQKGLKPFSK